MHVLQPYILALPPDMMEEAKGVFDEASG